MQIRIFFQMSTCVAAGTVKLNANSVCEKLLISPQAQQAIL